MNRIACSVSYSVFGLETGPTYTEKQSKNIFTIYIEQHKILQMHLVSHIYYRHSFRIPNIPRFSFTFLPSDMTLSTTIQAYVLYHIYALWQTSLIIFVVPKYDDFKQNLSDKQPDAWSRLEEKNITWDRNGVW